MSDHKKSKKRKSDAMSTSESVESHQNGSDDGQKLKKIKLEYVATNNNDCGPFIASFPHGPPPPYVLTNEDEGLKFVCLKRETKEEPLLWHKQLAAETNKVIYSASNFGADSQKTDLSKYMIGVYDKKSKTLKLVESPHIFKMDQHIKGLETKVTVDNMYKNLSYLEKRKILVDAFGTKRTRTTIRQLMSNKIDPSSAMDVDQVAADLIADKIKKDDENRVDGEDGDAAPVVENIPPYDPEATKPAKIFDINNIISMDEMAFLKSNKGFTADALKKRKPAASPVKEEGDDKKKRNEQEDNWYSTFVINRLKELEKLDSADKAQQARKERSVAALQYLNYLLRFHKFMGNFLPKDVPPAKMKMLPGVLYSRMVEKFAQIKSIEKQNYEKTKPLRLKLINYACVLVLIANGYETDVHLIADDIGMTQKQMKLHFQQVGCDLIYKKSKKAKKAEEEDDEDVVTTASSSMSLYVAKLKAPYKPPAPKRMGPPKKF